jgi:hypothetical protein
MQSMNRLRAVIAILPLIFLVASALPGYCSRRAAVMVPVAAGGQANAAIVVPDAPAESTQWAANEAQRYFRALSGAEIPIISQGHAGSSARNTSWILVGGPRQNRIVSRAVAAGLNGFSGLRSDGFVLKTFRLGKRPVVVAGGNSDAGTMYAVFELAKQLGVTFRLTGDIIPERESSLSVPALNLRKEPALDQRGFLVEASHHPSITMLSYEDWARLLDQMAKMKYNFLEFWWFAYQPWLNYSYRGETKLIGDLSTKASGYLNTMYDGFGSRTTDDVVIGKHWFPGRRLAPPELQHVETPDQAFTAAQDLLSRMIHYARGRHVKVWLVDEMASIPPNFARYTERIGDLPFNGIFGSFVHPLDPVNREIQVERLKARATTYPDAAGYFLNLPEVYYPQDTPNYRQFFAQPQQQAMAEELRALMVPWRRRFAPNRQEMAESTVGYFDLLKYLLARRDEIAPRVKLGVMTVGRGYVMPAFDKWLPKDVPFSTFDTGGPCGYGTASGMPMSYFGGMGQRIRIDTPYLDDDCDILGQQFNVWIYTQKDRIFTDGVKYGLTGVAPWMVQPRGTEANSTFLAQADWDPRLTREEFYKTYSQGLFGAKAAPKMYQAFMTLEQNKEYLARGFILHYPTTMGCCGPLEEVSLAHQYSLQENPFDGPKVAQWAGFIISAPAEIATLENSIALLNKALECMQTAEPSIAHRGKHELAYLISRTEAYRDDMQAQVTERKAFLSFDRAFRERGTVPQRQFVADLEASLPQFEAATRLARVAATEYARIIDYPSDLEALYHLNLDTVMGLDLVRQWMQTIVEFHEGKQYTRHVPFERIFTEEVHVANFTFR